MRNNLNILQNLYKIRDAMSESNDNVLTFVNFLSFYALEQPDGDKSLWRTFENEFPEDAAKVLDTIERPIHIVDPYGLFVLHLQYVEWNDSNDAPEFRITLDSDFDEDGKPQYSQSKTITYDWIGMITEDMIDSLYWTVKGGAWNSQQISGIEVLSRVSNGADLNQAVLLINDLIIQNGSATLDSINSRLSAVGVQDNESVQQLLVNLAAYEKLTAQGWVTTLYQMYNNNKEALDRNSLVLDASKLNVIQGFMIFGTTEIITATINIISIMLAAVTKGLSLLLGYLVQSFNQIIENYKDRGSFQVNSESSNSYFDIPIMAWKRPISLMKNSEGVIAAIMDDGYAKYIPTPFADYYFWIHEGYLYANAFLKLGAAPMELVAFGDLNQDAICGLEHVKASVAALDGEVLLTTLSSEDQIARAFSTSVLGFIFQNMVGFYNHWEGTGHEGLYPFFRGATVNFSTPIPNDYNLVISDDPAFKGENLSGEWMFPSVGIGYVIGLIAQGNGKPAPARISEIFRGLRAITNYCEVDADGRWNMYKSSLPSPKTNPNMNNNFGLKVMHPTGTVIAENVSYSIDIHYFNTAVLPSDIYHDIEWYGNCPNYAPVVKALFNLDREPFPSVSKYYLWSDIWEDSTQYQFDSDLVQITDVDTIPRDRMVTSPTVDLQSTAAALLIVGAATLIAVIAGAIVVRKFKTFRMARSLERKAALDVAYRNYVTSTGGARDGWRDILINQTRRYNRLASIFGWRQYDCTSGTYVPLGTISNGSASLFTSLSSKVIKETTSASEGIEEGVQTIITRIGKK